MTNPVGDFSEVDEQKLNQMKLQILQAERNNNNTKAKTRDGMIELILQTIKTIANKAY